MAQALGIELDNIKQYLYLIPPNVGFSQTGICSRNGCGYAIKDLEPFVKQVHKDALVPAEKFPGENRQPALFHFYLGTTKSTSLLKEGDCIGNTGNIEGSTLNKLCGKQQFDLNRITNNTAVCCILSGTNAD